jgi:RNA polymerase subunit RPABC4/transcription elongation factor Spt4
MYCPKCGEENPEDARFCMHCGADLSGYKMEISPKISVSAKAEGGVALKWKQKPIRYAEIKGYGKLPVYREFVTLEETPFCPLCGNYGCVEEESEILEGTFPLYHCSACNKYFCRFRGEAWGDYDVC